MALIGVNRMTMQHVYFVTKVISKAPIFLVNTDCSVSNQTGKSPAQGNIFWFVIKVESQLSVLCSRKIYIRLFWNTYHTWTFVLYDTYVYEVLHVRNKFSRSLDNYIRLNLFDFLKFSNFYQFQSVFWNN